MVNRRAVQFSSSIHFSVCVYTCERNVISIPSPKATYGSRIGFLSTSQTSIIFWFNRFRSPNEESPINVRYDYNYIYIFINIVAVSMEYINYYNDRSNLCCYLSVFHFTDRLWTHLLFCKFQKKIYANWIFLLWWWRLSGFFFLKCE